MAKRRTAGPGTSRGEEALADYAKSVKQAAHKLGLESVEEEYAALEKRSRAMARKLRAYNK